MQYLGGKYTLSKYLAPYLQESVERTDGFYEPFVGGNNVLWRINTDKPCVLSDTDQDLILLYQALMGGWVPPDNVSVEEYYLAKEILDPSPFRSFCKFACSFAGKAWSGYASNKRGCNYARAGKNSLLKTFRPAKYIHQTYCEFEPINWTIYCDPPYINTTGYQSGKFDHERFYDWCEYMAYVNDCDVFISEYYMPEDRFECIFDKHVRVRSGKEDNRRMVTDKLFKVRL